MVGSHTNISRRKVRISCSDDYSSESPHSNASCALLRARTPQKPGRAGKVKEFTEDMWGKIFFISHQWTSYNHPDPKKDQLKSLQHVLRRLANGEMSVKGNFAVECASAHFSHSNP